jgi:hypothetical protein
MAAHIIFTTKTIFASLAAIGIAGAAQAQAPSSLNIAGHAPTQAVGNIMGGGGATLSGGGDDRTITYSLGGAGSGASYEQPGRIATFGGNSGGSPYWTYGAPAPSGIGREAWLTGGGDDAQVIYAAPYQRR